MPHIPPLPPTQAPKESQAVYVEFHTQMEFPGPPNFIMTQGHSATTARGTWEAVRNILVGGEIPRLTKEMIFVAISHDRNCRYCEAAHIACCRTLGAHADTINHLVNDLSTVSDPKLQSMIVFAVKCSRDPQGLTAEDFDTLRRHGLTQSQIVELIGMAALAVYANIIADATGMEADKMFQKR